MTPSWIRREGLALLTDLYQLTMMAGHLKANRADKPVCFEYFFRSLPPHTGFAISVGLDPFLQFLENLRFEDDDIEYLGTLPYFDDEFLGYLRDFRLTCTVRAVPEGTLVFPFEPIIQVEGKIIEAQLLETALLNMMNYPTLIATKSSRVCMAAEGDPVMEFGLRRAHGPDGGLSGSRAAYIGGCGATSNVLAGKVYDIPVAGTHAHSWVMSFPSEKESFRTYLDLFPDNPILLVDTYDTIESGVPNAIEVFAEFRSNGKDIRPSIRLDSGDLAKLSKQAYAMMMEAGMDDPLIVASSELNEDLIADLKRQHAKINAWGVGTHLITGQDCPSLGGVYKLVAIQHEGEWEPRLKISSNMEKSTDPGRKALVRYFDSDDHPIGDVMYNAGEEWAQTGTISARQRTQPQATARLRDAARAESLLETVFHDGKRLVPPRSTRAIREYAQKQIRAMPEEFRRLRNPEVYRVVLSETLGELKADLMQQLEPA